MDTNRPDAIYATHAGTTMAKATAAVGSSTSLIGTGDEEKPAGYSKLLWGLQSVQMAMSWWSWRVG